MLNTLDQQTVMEMKIDMTTLQGKIKWLKKAKTTSLSWRDSTQISSVEAITLAETNFAKFDAMKFNEHRREKKKLTQQSMIVLPSGLVTYLYLHVVQAEAKSFTGADFVG